MEIRLRQVLTGRSPERGDNRKLWRKIYNLNRDIVLKVAKEIDKVAVATTDVLEDND